MEPLIHLALISTGLLPGICWFTVVPLLKQFASAANRLTYNTIDSFDVFQLTQKVDQRLPINVSRTFQPLSSFGRRLHRKSEYSRNELHFGDGTTIRTNRSIVATAIDGRQKLDITDYNSMGSKNNSCQFTMRRTRSSCHRSPPDSFSRNQRRVWFLEQVVNTRSRPWPRGHSCLTVVDDRGKPQHSDVSQRPHNADSNSERTSRPTNGFTPT